MAIAESILRSRDPHYTLHRGAIRGPFTIDQLITMRKNGSLDQYTKVSTDRAVWESLDLHLSAIAIAEGAPAPIVPPPFRGLQDVPTSGVVDPSQVQFLNPVLIRPFPVAALVLLHFLTLGLFSFFWITGSHGRLPKLKSDDPSGFQAIAMCFVPVLNVYWFFVVYLRLTQRVNALSTQYRLLAIVPEPLSYIISTLMAIPVLMAVTGAVLYSIIFFSPTSKSELVLIFFLLPQILTAVNYFFLWPIYSGLVQTSLNRISNVQIRLAIEAGK